jgi:predicted dehydrogenase
MANGAPPAAPGEFEKTQLTPALQVAVVGLGWWGRIVVSLLKGDAKLKVLKGVEPASAAAELGRSLGLEMASFEEVLADPAIQGVILCTPHSLHAAQIVAAANAGKHVFCETPLALSRADVLRAVKACNDNDVVLAVGHEKPFEPPVRALVQMAKAGELGKLLQVEANFSQDKFLSLTPDNWRMSATEAPAGPMTATGIHLLDLAVGLLGPAQQVYASVRQLGSRLVNGDSLAILVNHKPGGSSLISAILATPFDGRFAVYGNKGWAEVRDKTHPESPQGWTLTLCSRGGEKKVLDFPPAQAVLANLEAFADAAAKRAPYPVSLGQMIANVSALEAVFRSAASGRVEAVEN